MGKPSSQEDICNLMLDLLKQSPINSISTPVTNTEFIMARWYDVERQAALRAHPWKFATTRTTLTPNLTATPPFGYAYAYDLPSNYIRKVSIGNDFLGDIRMQHTIENGQILTPSGSNTPDAVAGSAALYLRYVYDCVDVGKFDSSFVKYLALMGAVDLSPKFSISPGLGRDLKTWLMDADTEAKAVNSQDAPIKRIQSSRILLKRRGLPGGIYANTYTTFES